MQQACAAGPRPTAAKAPISRLWGSARASLECTQRLMLSESKIRRELGSFVAPGRGHPALAAPHLPTIPLGLPIRDGPWPPRAAATAADAVEQYPPPFLRQWPRAPGVDRTISFVIVAVQTRSRFNTVNSSRKCPEGEGEGPSNSCTEKIPQTIVCATRGGRTSGGFCLGQRQGCLDKAFNLPISARFLETLEGVETRTYLQCHDDERLCNGTKEEEMQDVNPGWPPN